MLRTSEYSYKPTFGAMYPAQSATSLSAQTKRAFHHTSTKTHSFGVDIATSCDQNLDSFCTATPRSTVQCSGPPLWKTSYSADINTFKFKVDFDEQWKVTY